MNNYLFLAIKFITREPKKTILKCFGIILSVILIVSVFIITNNIDSNKIKQTKKISGDYHAKFNNLNSVQMNVLKNHINVKEVGIEKKLVTTEIDKQMITVDIGYYDENALKMLNGELIAGKFPENENEIVLEESVVRQLCLNEELDQMVCVSFPSQAYVDEKGKVFNKPFSIYYNLVGILKNRPQDKFTINTLGLVSKESIDYFNLNNIKYNVYIKIKDQLSINKNIDKIKEDICIEDKNIEYNNKLITEVNDNKNLHSTNKILYLIVILAASAIFCNIYNLSNIDKYGQVGLLRAYGTTSSQIIKILIIEILILSIISIPVGMIGGVFFLKLLIKQFSYFHNVIGTLAINGYNMVCCLFLSLFSIVIAVSIPIIKVSSTSIVDSLKANTYLDNSKIENKNLNSNKKYIKINLLRILGINGVIAYNNVWRNKKRAVITMASLSLGIILFIIVSSIGYSYNPTKIAKKFNATDYIIKGFQHTGYSIEDFSKIASLKGVKRIYRTQLDTIYLKMKKVNGVKYSNELMYEDNNQYELYKSNLYGYTDDTLKLAKESLIKGEIDIDRMNNNNIVILVNNSYSANMNLKVGDEISFVANEKYMLNYDCKEIKCVIGGIISVPTIRIFGETDGPSFILHENIYGKYINSKMYNQFNIDIIDNADKETLKSLDSVLNNIAHNIPNGSVVSFREEVEKYETYKKEIKILFLSLIIIIIAIGILSIMNTININLSLRIREFALFRAYGMTKYQLRKAIIMEGVIYGVISSFWGCLIGTIATKILFKYLGEYLTYISWSICYEAIIYSSIGCILLSIISSIIPLINFSKNNIVDSIRNEKQYP